LTSGGGVTWWDRVSADADDRDTYTAFVRSRQAALMRTAYLLTGDRYRAEDLLQGALVALALHWPKVRDREPEGFVRTVLYRDAVSWWRRRRRERLGAVPQAPSPGDLAEDVTRRLVLQRALTALSPRQRAVVVLRFYEDLGVEQTAAVLGVSPGTVKSQTHDALRRLREQLRADWLPTGRDGM
jgi:RNA polymerase sigma-70 factor (sigma-E family)